MQQIEVISWKTLDALKGAATKLVEIIGDLDTNEQMAIFCTIEDDFLELYYSEADSSYLRHYEDEDEFFKYIELRKKELGEDEFASLDYYDDEGNPDDENSRDDFDGFNIREEDEVDEF